jgi:16S rRNA (uracil1498-N3)-methyltransferase
MRDVTHNLFYIPPEKVTGDSLIISGEEFHHLKNVLRKNPGDDLVLTDGLGFRIEARVLKTDRREIIARVLKREPVDPFPTTNLDLALAPLKGTRTDLIIEKGTELGIRRFVFFTSQNSVVKEVTGGKIERYRKIALSAMLQSQRYFLPEFHVHGGTADLLGIVSSYDSVLVADPSGGIDVPPAKKNALFIVGPEGGLSGHELASLIKAGASALSLGRVRLRSETAAVAGIVKILTVFKVL